MDHADIIAAARRQRLFRGKVIKSSFDLTWHLRPKTTKFHSFFLKKDLFWGQCLGSRTMVDLAERLAKEA
jgi:hypothetical protein